jgi:hypothetical protein
MIIFYLYKYKLNIYFRKMVDIYYPKLYNTIANIFNWKENNVDNW